MVATIDRSRSDVHVVKGSGVVATDTARIAAVVAKIVARGFGTIVFDGSSAPGGIVYNNSEHRFRSARVTMLSTPGTRVVSTHAASTFWFGGHYDPWHATEGFVGGSIPLVSAGSTQIPGLPGFILTITATGGQYRLTINGSTTADISATANAATILAAINAVGALTDKVTVSGTGPYYFNVSGLQEDTMTVANGTSPLTGGTATVTSLGAGDWILLHAENTPSGITPHGSEPQRPMEFHRLVKPVVQNQARSFSLAISATAGQYRVTINGSQTADIAFNASSGTIQSAINAVPALNGKVTVSGTGPFTFLMAGNFAHQQNTMTAANGTTPLSGGSATATVTTTTSAPNKTSSFYIDAPLYDSYTTINGGSGAGFFKIPVVEGIRISDVQFESQPGLGPAASCLFFAGCTDLKIERCRFGADNGRMNPGVISKSFCSGTMEDCQICDHENPNATQYDLRYGSLDAVCNGFKHTRCTFGAVRHGFTSGGVGRTVSSVSYRYGTCLDGVVENCTFGTPPNQNPSASYGVASMPFCDFHSEVARYIVKGCKFRVTEFQVGFLIRSRSITFEGNYFECMGTSQIGVVYAQDFVFKNNRVISGYNLDVRNVGTNANVDRVRIVDNQFIDCPSAPLRFSTGTGHEVVGNSFHNCNATSTAGVTSPWTPKCCIHIAGLTNSSSTIRIANNVAPKFTNNDFFVYASGVNANQMEYVDNVVSGYGGTSIGLPRKRVRTGVPGNYFNDPTGAFDSAIAATPEWEMLYGWQNGQKDLKYVKKTGHGLTSTDLNKPIDKGGVIYDDTDGSKTPDGILADIVNDDYYVLYPLNATFSMPVTMLGGTYTMGTDPRDIYWDATASGGGKYMNNKPGDSAASAPPMLRVNHVDATNMWVTVLGQSAAGSVPYAVTLTLAGDDANCTVGDGKVFFQLPYDLDNISVTGMCSSAPTGSGMTGRLRSNGTIFTSPVVTIEVNETKSSDAVTQPGTTVSTLAAGSIISADQITIGSTLPGKGFKITLLGTIVG